nr:MAG: putative capsid protein [Arizlama virus]
MYGFKKRSIKGYRKTSTYRGAAPQYRPYSRGGYGRRYKRVGFSRRSLNTRIQRGVRARSLTVARKRGYGVPRKAAQRRFVQAVSRALATRGSWTFAGFTSRVGCATGEQAWLSSGANAWMSSSADFATVLTAAILRTTVVPNQAGGAANVISPPNFWITKAKMKVHIINTSQVDCDVIVYPWVARNDGVDPGDMYTAASVNQMQQKAGSTSTLQGLLTNTTSTVGFTPFMAQMITERAKLGKPRRIHLQGGQSYTYTLTDNKPLYVSYPRYVGSYSFAPHTRGCFMTAKGSPVNDTVDTDAIDFGFCALDVQIVTTYDWMVSTSAWKYNDVITNSADIQAIKIIQPQTGGVTTGPVSV